MRRSRIRFSVLRLRAQLAGKRRSSPANCSRRCHQPAPNRPVVTTSAANTTNNMPAAGLNPVASANSSPNAASATGIAATAITSATLVAPTATSAPLHAPRMSATSSCHCNSARLTRS